MRGNNMLQSTTINMVEQRSGRLVVKMPKSPGDALLERPGIGAFPQHPGVMVAFQHERIAAIQHVNDVRCNVADIGQHSQAPKAIANHELCRLAGVVGDREGKNFKIANAKRRVAIEEGNVNVLRQARRNASAMAKMNRKFEAGRTASNAAHVVAMFMGDKDCIDIARGQAKPTEPRSQFTRPKATIDQNTRVTRFNQQRISSATTAEGSETHRYFNCSCRRPRIFFDVSDLSTPPSRVSTWTVLAVPLPLTWTL